MGNIYENPKRYRYEIFRLFTEWGTNGNLNGDVRRNGLHSMLTDIVKPGGLEQVLIKMQHNTCSGGRSYSSKTLFRSYMSIFSYSKACSLYPRFSDSTQKKLDIRDSRSATWRDVVLRYSKSLEEHHPFQISTEKWKGMRRLFQSTLEG